MKSTFWQAFVVAMLSQSPFHVHFLHESEIQTVYRLGSRKEKLVIDLIKYKVTVSKPFFIDARDTKYKVDLCLFYLSIYGGGIYGD